MVVLLMSGFLSVIRLWIFSSSLLLLGVLGRLLGRLFGRRGRGRG
jgi:hypothetical protein